MKQDILQVAVLFLVFNRPATTIKVFEAIRAARPARLYVVADGPRDDKPGERAECEKVRRIATMVDWPCEVRALFRDKNMGCGKGVAAGISWFFSQEEEGIILEDDCLPATDFFQFCAELLEKYRDDTRVMQIGGNNLQASRYGDSDYSYFFSNHNVIWGWATWRRAWELYDYRMTYYEEVIKKKYHYDYFQTFDEHDYYEYVLSCTHSDGERISTWDYQWQFSRMLQSGLVIVPWQNLVVNIGWGIESTHTHEPVLHGQTLGRMIFPLRHPEFVMVDRKLDARLFNAIFTSPWSRVKRRIKKILPQSFVVFSRRLLHVNYKEAV